MNGTPSAAVISFSVPATSICSCSDSTTHGPAIRNRGCSSPASKPQSFMRTALAVCRPRLAGARLVRERGADERLEERMAAPRRRLELGVELDADEPRVHARAAARSISVSFSRCVIAEITRPASVQPVEVLLVGLVAVAVPLGHARCRRSRCASVPGLTSELCAPRRIVPPRSECAVALLDACRRGRPIRRSARSPGARRGDRTRCCWRPARPAMWRAYSIVATCMPRQMPR